MASKPLNEPVVLVHMSLAGLKELAAVAAGIARRIEGVTLFSLTWLAESTSNRLTPLVEQASVGIDFAHAEVERPAYVSQPGKRFSISV